MVSGNYSLFGKTSNAGKNQDHQGRVPNREDLPSRQGKDPGPGRMSFRAGKEYAGPKLSQEI